MNWDELSGHQLKIYSTPWCSDCRRLKDRMTEHKVQFHEINIDSEPEAAEFLAKKTGHRAIPYVEIDEKWIIRGWHKEEPGRWQDSIFFSEIEAALNT